VPGGGPQDPQDPQDAIDPIDRAYRVGDAALEAPPPADRRRLIRALGTVQIVFGVLSGLTGLAMAAVGIAAVGSPLSFAVLLPIASAANLLLTGIGSVRLARWARRATLISAFVWVALIAGRTIQTFARFAGMPYERVMAGVIGLVMVTFGITLIAMYTRPSVRATFERAQAS